MNNNIAKFTALMVASSVIFAAPVSTALAAQTRPTTQQVVGNISTMFNAEDLKHAYGVLNINVGDIWSITFPEKVKEYITSQADALSVRIIDNRVLIGSKAIKGTLPLLIVTESDTIYYFQAHLIATQGGGIHDVLVKDNDQPDTDTPAFPSAPAEPVPNSIRPVPAPAPIPQVARPTTPILVHAPTPLIQTRGMPAVANPPVSIQPRPVTPRPVSMSAVAPTARPTPVPPKPIISNLQFAPTAVPAPAPVAVNVQVTPSLTPSALRPVQASRPAPVRPTPVLLTDRHGQPLPVAKVATIQSIPALPLQTVAKPTPTPVAVRTPEPAPVEQPTQAALTTPTESAPQVPTPSPSTTPAVLSPAPTPISVANMPQAEVQPTVEYRALTNGRMTRVYYKITNSSGATVTFNEATIQITDANLQPLSPTPSRGEVTIAPGEIATGYVDLEGNLPTLLVTMTLQDGAGSTLALSGTVSPGNL